ncbi:primase-helicase family protein [Bradyrhizobium sp. UFLA05-153]
MPLPKPPIVRSADGAIGLEDFYAIPETNRFMFMPTRTTWPRESVDSILPKILTGKKKQGKLVTIKASEWLKQNRRVEQVTWMPGLPQVIEDKLLSDGGWKDRPGAHALNLYQAPQLVHGDATQAGPWIEHVRLLYPDDAEDIIDWCAHRVQRPHEKINYALVLGGYQGIGKDWILEAVEKAIGEWNFHNVSPTELLDKYNPFVKAVVMRLNEAHDLGEGGRANRYALYERIKGYAAAPPNVLSCVDKYEKRIYVPNVLGLCITTNHKADGVHLETDDRRHRVAWSEKKKEEFSAEFWTEQWHWLRNEGGAAHVAAYLAQRDLSAFKPGAVPRQTDAFFEIVHASQAPEDGEIADALDELGRPDIVTLAMLIATERGAALEWLLDKKHRRSIPYKMETCGYVAVRNPDAEKSDGLWKIDGRRQTVYGKARLTSEQRRQAARDHVQELKKAASKAGSGMNEIEPHSRGNH